ncbi:MAG: hypothetical protein ACLU3I_19400 [Acutalibacteraceae bacterium]
MTHTYDVVLDGQLGQRFGQLRWKENGSDAKECSFCSAFRTQFEGVVRETRLYSRTS